MIFEVGVLILSWGCLTSEIRQWVSLCEGLRNFHILISLESSHCLPGSTTTQLVSVKTMAQVTSNHSQMAHAPTLTSTAWPLFPVFSHIEPKDFVTAHAKKEWLRYFTYHYQISYSQHIY